MASDEQREELARIIHNIAQPDWDEDAFKAAEAILRAGWRKPRTVETVEELDALPEKSIILDRVGYAWQKLEGYWVSWLDPGETSKWLANGGYLPALVLWTPGDDE